MSQIKINKKLFHVASGKSFDKFVKEVDATTNDNVSADNEMFHHIMKRMVKTIANNVDWKKLTKR